jgi:Major Facilitator Superfamily
MVGSYRERCQHQRLHVAFDGLLLLGGRAGDILGRRRMFIFGLALFSLGSLLGGLATTFQVLLGGRGIQGIGGAIGSPTPLSLITVSFREGRERSRAFAVYAAVSGAGGARWPARLTRAHSAAVRPRPCPHIKVWQPLVDPRRDTSGATASFG